MSVRIRRVLVHCVRILVCLGALWIMARGVTLRDRVYLKSGEPVSGTVVAVTDAYIDCTDSAGQIRRIAVEEVAVEEGSLRISYGLATAWATSDKRLLVLAMLVHFPVVFPLALRFQWLLAAQGIVVGYWECLKLTFAGNFLNFATPLGSHAGDAFKAYFASLHTERKTEAVTTVVWDRVIGLGTLLVVAAVITLAASSAGKLSILRPYVLGLLGLGTIGGAVYFSPLLPWLWRRRDWTSRSPSLEHLRRFDSAARTLLGRWGILGGAIVLTVVLQWLALGSYFIVAMAMNLRAGLGEVVEYYAYFYAGTLVQALPGPPQGLGTVELTYRYFFAPFGSPSQIVCMALVIRIVVLICALPGLLVTMTGGYRPKAMEEIMHPSGNVVSEAASGPPTASTSARPG